MDSNNVYSRTLLGITVSEKISTASARRAKVYDAKERGYCSIKLAEDLMDTLNQNFGVRETLSNLVKFSSSSEFQEDALSFNNQQVVKNFSYKINSFSIL